MNRQPPQLARLVLVASLFTLTAPVVAASPPSRDRLHLSYAAPSSCPVQADFETRVSSRVIAPWLAPDGESSRLLRVTVESNNGTWQASLELEDQSGRVLSRSVTANSCEASVEAIALVTALLLESSFAPANARAVAPREATASKGAPAPGDTVSSQGAPAPGDTVSSQGAPAPGDTVSSQGAPAPNDSVSSQGAPATMASASTASRQYQAHPDAALLRPPNRSAAHPIPELPSNPHDNHRTELGGSVGILTGIGSDVAHSATLFGGFSTELTLSRLGLAVHQSDFAATDVDGVRLRVRLLAAKIEHCPWSISLARGLRGFACIGVETGILFTDGRAEPGIHVDARSDQALWFMAGLTPKLGYRWKRIFAELEPELFVPVTRREFAVSSDTRANPGGLELAHRTPVLAFGGFSSLGLLFE